MVLNSTKNFGVEKKLRSLPSRAISTIVSPTKLNNILRGIVPVASGWDTAPTNLERCTDGDFAIVTGTGETVKAAAGTYGYLIFDLGSIKTILLGGRFGLWSTTGNAIIFTNESDDNVNYREGNPYIMLNTSVAETVRPATPIILCGRYIRLRFSISTAATAYAKIYEIMAWELNI